jgi:ferredoxin
MVHSLLVNSLTWDHLTTTPFWLVLIGHIAFDRTGVAAPIGKIHYFLHWIYGKYEPAILRLVDWHLRKKFFTETFIGRGYLTLVTVTLGRYLPHSIVVSPQAAIRVIRYIGSLQSHENSPKLAVGPCVCQKALDRWQEPSCKDIVVLYGAEIYLSLNLGYRIIEPDEAIAIVEQSRDAGLVQTLDFCMQSGRWYFVICNCDKEICVMVRLFLASGQMAYPGPEIVLQSPETCLGVEQCGQCVAACFFGANAVKDGKMKVDYKKCFGCAQCVRVCKGNTRKMVTRHKYGHDHIVPAKILLGE